MNVALRRPMDVAEFLAWEERQPAKYEFDGFQPVAMVGVTNAHSIIQGNLTLALGSRLRGTACRVHGSDLKISVGGSIRYPDAFVICTPSPALATVMTEPVVVFEILSDSSEHRDLIVKNREYWETLSIQHYVVLEQGHAGVLAFTRRDEGWASEALSGDDAIVRLPAIAVEITLAELYADVPFSNLEEVDA